MRACKPPKGEVIGARCEATLWSLSGSSGERGTRTAGWKPSVSLGKVNNQKFVGLPHGKLIGQIRDKAAAYGIPGRLGRI